MHSEEFISATKWLPKAGTDLRGPDFVGNPNIRSGIWSDPQVNKRMENPWFP